MKLLTDYNVCIRMSASYEESNLISKLVGEMQQLQNQMQSMSTGTRVDIKEYKKLERAYKEKTKMYTMMLSCICTRISDKNKD